MDKQLRRKAALRARIAGVPPPSAPPKPTTLDTTTDADSDVEIDPLLPTPPLASSKNNNAKFTYNQPFSTLLSLFPPSFYFISLLACFSFYLLPSLAPHSISSVSSNPYYLKYTLPMLDTVDQSTVAMLLALPFLILLACKYILHHLIPVVRPGVRLERGISYLFVAYLLLLAYYVSNTWLSSYLIVTSSTPSYCASHHSYAHPFATHTPHYTPTLHCLLSTYLFSPVPHVELSMLDTKTGGAHPLQRVNQIMYAGSRYGMKQSLHVMIGALRATRGYEYYPVTYLTHLEEKALQKIEGKSNATFPWIVKGGEGIAKRLTWWHGGESEDADNGGSLGGMSVNVGYKVFETLGTLKGHSTLKGGAAGGKDVEAKERGIREKALMGTRQREHGHSSKVGASLEENVARTEVIEKMLEGLKTSPEDINVRDNQTNAPSKRREETVPEGFHVVQKYITDPKLLYGYKTTMSVPVIMTSLEPVRFHIHRDETKVNFACEPYVEEEVWPEVAGKEWMRRHYTKCGEVRKLGDVKLHSMPWAAIDNAVSGILLGGLEDLKEDIKVAREMFMHSGSRPTGSGGTVSESEAKRLAKEHARLSGEWEEENFEKRKEMQRKNKAEAEAKGELYEEVPVEKKVLVSEDFRTADPAAFLGGGFHLFNFEFLIDRKGKPWMLDVDSLPSNDREYSSRAVAEGGGSEKWMGEELIEDVMKVAGWIDNVKLLGVEGEGLMEGSVIKEVCEGFAEFSLRNDTILCQVRLKEMAQEIWGGRSAKRTGHGFAVLHPTVESCELLREERRTMDVLDVEQCSAILVQAGKLSQAEIMSVAQRVDAND